MSATDVILTLKITNAHLLPVGSIAQWGFTAEGGTIGSDDSVMWKVEDHQNGVKPQHCRLLTTDGELSIQDLCGETYVNSTQMALGNNKQTKLAHKDEIKIGPYWLRVSLASEEDLEANLGLEALVMPEKHDLVASLPLDNDIEKLPERQSLTLDPLISLGEVDNNPEQKAYFLLADEGKTAGGDEPADLMSKVSDEGQRVVAMQADTERDISSAFRLKKILGWNRKKPKAEKEAQTQSNLHQPKVHYPSGENKMVNHGSELNMNNNVESELDLLEEEVAKSLSSSKRSKPSSQANPHLLTGPLLTGLGVNVSNAQDMERMQALSEELGRSLQSCIKGLLQLNQQVVQGSFDALGRNLQPIEDNPLRLGLSYEDTVHTMYDTEKSPVHLSAPAAITESLQQVCRHNIAMQYATTEALNHILKAFSPEVLLKRFHHYKRNIDGNAQSEDAWAWQMYSHYYRELTSHRQKGFEKLFWEVFEQAYDKKIREQQMDTSV